MTGSALRKYAQQHGLACSGGWAYGKLCGCFAVLDEGQGWKRLRIYLHPPARADEDRDAQVLRVLGDCDRKAFRLKDRQYNGLSRRGDGRKPSPLRGDRAIQIVDGFAQLVFHDTFGTMKRMARYVDEVLPKLEGLVSEGGCCAHCGAPMGEDVRLLQVDGEPLPVHDCCARAVMEQIQIEDDEPRPGSVLMGILGALAGAVLGAVPTALTMALGYVSALCGLITGMLANFFYGKFGGKRGIVRIPIVLLALVLGAGLGQVGGYTLNFVQEYGKMEDNSGASRAEFVRYCWEEYLLYDQETVLGIEYDREVAKLDPAEMEDVMTREEFIRYYYNAEIQAARLEMRDAFAKDYMQNLVFALLGCVGLFAKIHWQEGRRRVRELD